MYLAVKVVKVSYLIYPVTLASVATHTCVSVREGRGVEERRGGRQQCVKVVMFLRIGDILANQLVTSFIFDSTLTCLIEHYIHCRRIFGSTIPV